MQNHRASGMEGEIILDVEQEEHKAKPISKRWRRLVIIICLLFATYWLLNIGDSLIRHHTFHSMAINRAIWQLFFILIAGTCGLLFGVIPFGRHKYLKRVLLLSAYTTILIESLAVVFATIDLCEILILHQKLR